MARIWDPSSASDAMWERSRARFTKAEMVEPGSFAATSPAGSLNARQEGER